MHEARAVTLGVDVGGTKLCAAAVDAAGRVPACERRRAPRQGYEHALEAIAEACAAVQRRAGAVQLTGAGVATAAFFDADRTRVLYAPNLGWRDRALGTDLERRLALPVVVENDADAAVWGEYVHGAAQGEDCVVCGVPRRSPESGRPPRCAPARWATRPGRSAQRRSRAAYRP